MQRPSIDRNYLDPVIEPIVRAHGGELVDVEFASEAQGWVLRILVEKAGSAEKKASTKDSAIGVDLCAKVARELSPALDVADVIPHRYQLEVGSPGVERPLRKPQDFERFLGEPAKLKLRAPHAGQRILRGTLGAFHDETVVMQDGKATYEIPFSEIEDAHLVFEFGPAVKPGHKPGQKHGQKRTKG